MPKELVFSKTKNGDPDTESPVVRTGWSKEAYYVELGTIHKDTVILEPTPEGNGWFVQLDRDGINKLIRVLRRARKQVYGKDE